MWTVGHTRSGVTRCRCRCRCRCWCWCWGGGGQGAVVEAGCQTQRWPQQTVAEAGAAVARLVEAGVMEALVVEAGLVVAWLVVAVALPISVLSLRPSLAVGLSPAPRVLASLPSVV